MDGLTSSREIRQFERDSGCPAAAIITLTGAASIGVRQEAFRIGIDVFLTKPVPISNLRRILQDVMTHRRDGLG
jgi:CheY-like chemotaxis protein